MKPLPITVIILAHRNDENLKKSITSAACAAEIMVVDNNSGVDWAQFTEQSLTIIEEKDGVSDFSKIRNNAIQKAKHDWVFFLDSDEEIQLPVVPQLAAILASPTAKGAVVFRSDVFYSREIEYGEAGHQQLLRIGKKDSLRYSGKVHETASVNGDLIYSKIKLLHYAHPSISEFIDDVSHYAQQVAAIKETTKLQNLFELLVFPPVKFFYGFIIQGGVMDGWRGLVYAACMSLHSLLVRIYRYELLANLNKRA